MLQRRMVRFFNTENTIWINATLCITSCMISFVYIFTECHLSMKAFLASTHLFVIHKCIVMFTSNVKISIDFTKRDYYLNAYSDKKMFLYWVNYSWSIIVFPIVSVAMEVMFTRLSWFSGLGKILISVSLSYLLFLANAVGYIVANDGVFKRGTFGFALAEMTEYFFYYILSARMLPFE